MKLLNSFVGVYKEFDPTVPLDELYVDLTYQRKLKLLKILQHLKRKYNGKMG